MKNVAALKSDDVSSPKTPGGISKSLLTPCRRLGLSRNWKKKGPSPFISPLSNSSIEVNEDKQETRKRKEPVQEEIIEQTDNIGSDVNTENIDKTPSRKVEPPRRKKSKTFLSSITQPEIIPVPSAATNENEPELKSGQIIETDDIPKNIDVTTPVRKKSKSNKVNPSPKKSSPPLNKIDNLIDTNSTKDEKCNSPKEELNNEKAIYKVKERSPNDLGKECIVVIQRKLFKNIDRNNTEKSNENNHSKPASEDEEPLINLQRQNSTKTKAIIDSEDEDFDKTVTIKKTKSISTKVKPKAIKYKQESQVAEKKTSSGNDFHDDDDDDFDDKKTILIRKTYNKVVKPIKAKSTGSITQKDIDNLKQRIEAKKKLLLAQSLTPDTEELRNLIKKWQKGCQDALMDLLDLMKSKFPDKERMDYSEMLQTLKIPPSLVGYDSENDCFVSPDDSTIILGKFKDL